MRVEHRAALHAIIAGVFAQLPATEILDRLERADIACARRNTMEEFVDHPQLAARHRWRDGRLAARPVAGARAAGADRGVEPVHGPRCRRWGSTRQRFSKSSDSTPARSRPGGRSR